MSEMHGNPSDHHSTPAALPEPATPMWLPALGLALFLVVGLLWGLSPATPDAATSGAAGSATASARPAPSH